VNLPIVAGVEQPPLVLFVCFGNICRSPMAEVIVADEAQRTGASIRVASAGLGAHAGNPATEYARGAVEEVGLSLDGHRSRPLTRDMVSEAALVVTATLRHRDDMRHFFRDDSAKIVSFGELTGLGELNDPFGSGEDEFRRLRDQLRRGAPAILAAINRGR
jgi:protein-tyrosine phosphatase